MTFEPPPGLPQFLRDQLHGLDRRAYMLESGADAGRILHFVDHGDPQARPVLMQHGNPTWSFLWRKVIRRLDPTQLRCVAPDLLGFGLSSKLPRVEDHQVTRHVDALQELVEALDLREVILVGQDWGGMLLACLAARVPDRIAGVVLANTSVLLPPRLRGTWFHRFAATPWISDLVFRWGGFPQRGGLAMAQGDRRSMAGEVGRAYRWPLEGVANRAGPLGLARMVPTSADHPSLPALREGDAWARSFKGPAALVWGEADPILGKSLKHHVAAFPNAPVTRTRAGHFLQEEVPEELARATRLVAGRAPAWTGAPATQA
jgi:pimeloyl-ACP methyl ester carboxylesterase